MRILFYCLTFYPENSGYSNAFQNLVKAITNYYPEVQIDLVTPNNLGDKAEFSAPNVNVIRLNYKLTKNKLGFFLNSYLFAKQFNQLFLKQNYDLAFVETFEDYVFLSNLHRNVYKKLLVRVHSTFETEYMVYFPNFKYKLGKYILKNFVFNKVKYVASTNNFHIDFIKTHYLDNNLYHIAHKGYFTLPNTMPMVAGDTQGDSIPVGKLKFFTLGRMDEGGYLQKGFDDLLNALILIKDKVRDKIEVKIVGKGDYQAKLKSKAKENNLSFIQFIDGFTHHETLEQLIASDVVILPSRYEGLSMFALEAIATSNAVLFSNTGGLIDLVENNGFLFEPQNVEDMACKIEKLVFSSPVALAEMKRNSVNVFTAKFSEKATADKFYNILKIVKADN
ncbi:glycosyltransferase family 4 protein [Pontibacter sp. FD36]|uniref:glycosyltransferase family 4 protein n=1 Tax=Pontibacter sp. FD36 TaxID=2789860 RepID=UPI0018ABA707|nr:glycosyltransferase family 4 protein [Pontibacter sp. FD36]MBF8964581.1 glycosyltransferase family 4 protein [Pontibacter sp. FD36]